MKDPTALLLALVNMAWGTSCIFFPHWYFKKASPDQATLDRRIYRWLGFGLACLGLVILARCIVQ